MTDVYHLSTSVMLSSSHSRSPQRHSCTPCRHTSPCLCHIPKGHSRPPFPCSASVPPRMYLPAPWDSSSMSLQGHLLRKALQSTARPCGQHRASGTVALGGCPCLWSPHTMKCRFFEGLVHHHTSTRLPVDVQQNSLEDTD